MKKVFLLSFLLFLLNISFAQENPDKCYTDDILQEMLAENPALADQMQLIENQVQDLINSGEVDQVAENVYVIPTVVHVVWHTSQQNITDEKAISQIRVLNEDYRKMQGTLGFNDNAVGSNTRIHFRLAQFDPDGNSTNGITRTETSVTSFPSGGGAIYNTNQGGKDAWDQDKYFNIWVCNISGGILGWSYLPGTAPPGRDGVVCLWSAFGDNSPAYPYHKGRTATHEIGHYLDLLHTWGNSGGCGDDDLVDDTPNSSGPNFGCPTDPVSCSSIDMNENYMDYSDDLCFNIFTDGQNERMTATNLGFRASLFEDPPFTTVEMNLTVRDASVTDNDGPPQVVTFGFDDYADDNINMSLGEVEIDPEIDPGTFDARFVLPSGTEGTIMDLRSTEVENTIWELVFTSADNNYPFTFEWDETEFPSGTFTLRDDASTFEVDMKSQSVFELTDETISTLYIDYTFEEVPVELTSFAASVVDNNISLNWNTATETNNHGFEVERAFVKDENKPANWNKVGFVPSAGTTTDPQNYSFVDRELSSGKYLYRLKIMDFDGSFEYSNVVEAEIERPLTYSLTQNYPNPFNPSTKISYEIAEKGNVQLRIYDALGKEIAVLVNGEKEAGSYSVNFDASSLSSGVYFYKLVANNFVQTRKMILTK